MEKSEAISVRTDKETKARIKAAAAAEKRTVSQWMEIQALKALPAIEPAPKKKKSP